MIKQLVQAVPALLFDKSLLLHIIFSMILRRHKDHFILLDDGVLVGTTRWTKVPGVGKLYMHQCQNAFIGLFHELEIEVDVDMTLDDNGYINQIRRRDGQ